MSIAPANPNIGIVPPWLTTTPGVTAGNPGIVPPWLAKPGQNIGIVPPWLQVDPAPVALATTTEFIR